MLATGPPDCEWYTNVSGCLNPEKDNTCCMNTVGDHWLLQGQPTIQRGRGIRFTPPHASTWLGVVRALGGGIQGLKQLWHPKKQNKSTLLNCPGFLTNDMGNV